MTKLQKTLRVSLVCLTIGNSVAQINAEIGTITPSRFEQELNALQSQDEKAALLKKAVQAERADLIDKGLELNQTRLIMDKVIRELPSSSVKDRAILAVLRAPPEVWSDAEDNQPENPMAGVNRVAMADLCVSTLQKYLPREDFDLSHDTALKRFANRKSREEIADKLESVIASSSKI